MRISFSLVLNLNLTCFLNMHFIKSCNLSLYRLLRPLSFMEIVSLSWRLYQLPVGVLMGWPGFILTCAKCFSHFSPVCFLPACPGRCDSTVRRKEETD